MSEEIDTNSYGTCTVSSALYSFHNDVETSNSVTQILYSRSRNYWVFSWPLSSPINSPSLLCLLERCCRNWGISWLSASSPNTCFFVFGFRLYVWSSGLVSTECGLVSVRPAWSILLVSVASKHGWNEVRMMFCCGQISGSFAMSGWTGHWVKISCGCCMAEMGISDGSSCAEEDVDWAVERSSGRNSTCTAYGASTSLSIVRGGMLEWVWYVIASGAPGFWLACAEVTNWASVTSFVCASRR